MECCLCASVQRAPHLFFFPPFPDFPAGAADPEVEAVGSGFLWRLWSFPTSSATLIISTLPTPSSLIISLGRPKDAPPHVQQLSEVGECQEGNDWWQQLEQSEKWFELCKTKVRGLREGTAGLTRDSSSRLSCTLTRPRCILSLEYTLSSCKNPTQTHHQMLTLWEGRKIK